MAVVGLAGSGKSEVVKIIEKFGFTKIYFGAITAEELKKRNLAVNEKNERSVREAMREELGMAAYAIKNEPLIKAGLEKGNVVIDGLYSWEEYLYLKKIFSQLELVAVLAPPTVRYKRLTTRPVRPLSESESLSRDISQIEKLHQAGPIAMADYFILNTDPVNTLLKKVKEVING